MLYLGMRMIAEENSLVNKTYPSSQKEWAIYTPHQEDSMKGTSHVVCYYRTRMGKHLISLAPRVSGSLLVGQLHNPQKSI